MNEYERIEQRIFSAMVFDNNGSYRPGMKAFWGPVIPSHAFAESLAKEVEMRNASLHLEYIEWYTPEHFQKFLKVGPFQTSFEIKTGEGALITTLVTISAETLWQAFSEEVDRETRAFIYRSTHDAYGREKNMVEKNPNADYFGWDDPWFFAEPVNTTTSKTNIWSVPGEPDIDEPELETPAKEEWKPRW